MLKHPRSLRTAKVGKKAKILKRQICQSIHVRVTVGATTADSNWGRRMLHTVLLLDLKLNRLRNRCPSVFAHVVVGSPIVTSSGQKNFAVSTTPPSWVSLLRRASSGPEYLVGGET
jgi:hypothetical protein